MDSLDLGVDVVKVNFLLLQNEFVVSIRIFYVKNERTRYTNNSHVPILPEERAAEMQDSSTVRRLREKLGLPTWPAR